MQENRNYKKFDTSLEATHCDFRKGLTALVYSKSGTSENNSKPLSYIRQLCTVEKVTAFLAVTARHEYHFIICSLTMLHPY